jgi:chaperonin GroEL
MKASEIRFDGDARERLLQGIDILARAVSVTLGPRGRNVIIGTKYGIGTPRITKDGVTVVREVELADKGANMGVLMLREVASRTSYEAGDGTTTATVLAHALMREGVRAVAAGLNPMDLKRGIDRAVERVVDELKTRSKPVATMDEIAHVGTVSANGDRDVGELMAHAIEKVGNDGVITIQEGRSRDTEMDFVDGMQFDRGYVSPSFVTQPVKMICELDDAHILLHEKKLDEPQALVPLLEAAARSSKPILIIADDFAPSVLATLVANNGRAGLRMAAVKSPRFGEHRKAMLEDIAVLTGGRLFADERGTPLRNASLAMLGRAKTVRVEKEKTIIIDGAGRKAEIVERTSLLRAQIAEAPSEYDRMRLKERLAKLASGVAVIRVGGATQVELSERKDRVQNALAASRAAMAEGIVAGGGAALLHATKALDQVVPENEDERAGIEIVRRALRAPARQIAANAGVDATLVVGKLLDNLDANYGFDAQSCRYVDMMAAGIVDPTKVVRYALEDAASVAGLLLTTEAMIAP